MRGQIRAAACAARARARTCPGTTANAALRAGRWTGRVIANRVAVELLLVPVGRPLPHVPGHLVAAAPAPAALLTVYRYGPVASALLCVGVVRIPLVAPRIGRRFGPACRVLPLRFRGHPAAAPASVRLRLEPGQPHARLAGIVELVAHGIGSRATTFPRPPIVRPQLALRVSTRIGKLLERS